MIHPATRSIDTLEVPVYARAGEFICACVYLLFPNNALVMIAPPCRLVSAGLCMDFRLLFPFAQVILGMSRLCYDDCLLRSGSSRSLKSSAAPLGSNKLFATIAAGLRNMSTLVFHEGSQAFSSLESVPPRIRTLQELEGAGLQNAGDVDEPFSKAEFDVVRDALVR